MNNRKINILDDKTIVKIAAGEIIENPASIIKELIENSIDAQADKITVEIKNNGKDLIKIIDNGIGFTSLDLDLAFKRHATSKITNILDLKDASTLGFRGEALSSIAYVSDIEIISKVKEDNLGTRARVDHSGNIIEKSEIVSQNGTSLFCKNLFDTIPVRDIYLSSRNYEINKTNEIITRLALSNPDISLSYYNDNKLILKTNSSIGLKNNLFSILGSDIASNLVYIEYKSDNLNIKGYISNNNLYRSNRNNQYIFINGRSIEDRDITKSVEDAYKSIIPLNKFPVFILYIDLDNKYIDVNIHPKKNIVKFTNINEIQRVLYKIITNKINENLLVHNIGSIETSNLQDRKEDETIFDIYNDDISEKSIIKINDLTDLDSLDDNKPLDDIIPIEENIPIDAIENNFINEDEGNYEDTSEREIILPNGYRYIGSFLNKYLLLEDSIDKSLYFLDQHGAHERINYEKLKRDYENKSVNRQNLLSGYIINLSASDFQYILYLRDLLNNIGVEIDEFGDNSIIVRSVPVYLDNLNPETLIDKILANIDFSNNLYEIDPYEIMKMACSASIKSGDYVSVKSVNKLIEELKATEMPLTCPHGRPTMVKLSLNQLDKEFYRIQNG